MYTEHAAHTDETFTIPSVTGPGANELCVRLGGGWGGWSRWSKDEGDGVCGSARLRAYKWPQSDTYICLFQKRCAPPPGGRLRLYDCDMTAATATTTTTTTMEYAGGGERPPRKGTCVWSGGGNGDEGGEGIRGGLFGL